MDYLTVDSPFSLFWHPKFGHSPRISPQLSILPISGFGTLALNRWAVPRFVYQVIVSLQRLELFLLKCPVGWKFNISSNFFLWLTISQNIKRSNTNLGVIFDSSCPLLPLSPTSFPSVSPLPVPGAPEITVLPICLWGSWDSLPTDLPISCISFFQTIFKNSCNFKFV